MKCRRILALLLALAMTAGLCACGKKEEEQAAEDGYTVTLTASAGTGFYWECSLSEDKIVKFTDEQEISNDLLPGSPIPTTFTFYGLKRGEVTATFVCKQSWDDSVTYQQSCELSVDRDRVVTGEMSGQTVTIQPGGLGYELTATDSSIAIWIDNEDGSYTFTPLREGNTTLTFTTEGSEENQELSRVFYMSIAQDGTFSVSEDTALRGTNDYDSLDKLERKVGFSMCIPEGAVPGDISSVDTLAFMSFNWEGLDFVYVGGQLDIGEFFTDDGKTMTIAGIEVGLPVSEGTLAGWEKDEKVYYISCDEKLSDEKLTDLLTEILTAGQAGEEAQTETETETAVKNESVKPLGNG